MARKKKRADPPSALEGASTALAEIFEERDEAARSITSIDEMLGGYSPVPFTGMVSSPGLAGAGASPGAATSVLPGGTGAVPEPEEGPGFLAAFWPLLLALAVGALAYFLLGWSWWASGLVLVATLVLARFGAAFMQAGEAIA